MGRSDSPLTPDGITVAKQVAWLVEQQKIRTVFSSPLGERARSECRDIHGGYGPSHTRNGNHGGTFLRRMGSKVTL